MVMPRSNDWRTWVQMGANPGFDPRYNAAVSGGSPDAWAAFRQAMLAADPAAQRAYGAQQLADFQRADQEALNKRRGGGRQASPTSYDADTAAALRAELKAAGMSDADIDIVLGAYKSGDKSADKIREEAGLPLGGSGGAGFGGFGGGGSGGDGASGAFSNSYTGPDARADITDERGLSFDDVFTDTLASFLPQTLAPQARQAVERRRNPLQAQILMGQALGDIPLEADLRSLVNQGFQNRPGITSTGSAFDQFRRLGGLLNSADLDERQIGALTPFFTPENQRFAVQEGLAQTVAPHLRNAVRSAVERDYARFLAPGGGTDANYLIDYYQRRGR